MKKAIALMLLIVNTVSFSGCATIVSGKTQDVTIRSTPPGVDLLIDGSVSGTTPMIANLVRKRRHTVVFKKAGESDITRATTRSFNWWYLGNLILGGLIGLIVDPITGAMYKVKPEEIYVDYQGAAGTGSVLAPAPAVSASSKTVSAPSPSAPAAA